MQNTKTKINCDYGSSLRSSLATDHWRSSRPIILPFFFSKLRTQCLLLRGALIKLGAGKLRDKVRAKAWPMKSETRQAKLTTLPASKVNYDQRITTKSMLSFKKRILTAMVEILWDFISQMYSCWALRPANCETVRNSKPSLDGQ